MVVEVTSGILGPVFTIAAAFCALWFVRKMVVKDFFLPRRLIRPNLLGRAFPYCWVIGIAFTSIFAARSIGLFVKHQLFSGNVAVANGAFSLPMLWARMGIPAKAVVIILFIMSIWSLAVIIDRTIYFNAAR